MTKEGKVKWDEALEYRAKTLAEVAELKELLSSEPNHPEREEIEADIEYVEEAFRGFDERLKVR